MIAFKYKDYFVYFDDADIAALLSGSELCVSMLNYLHREPLLVRLTGIDVIRTMSENKDREALIFFNETNLAVVEMSESEPTHHTLTFETLWFQEMIQKMISGTLESVTIRWGADKITILAGEGNESKRFKLIYGP